MFMRAPIKKVNEASKLLFSALMSVGLSCAVCAQDKPADTAFVMSQTAVYSQGLPQSDGSLLVAEDFTYASEGISFYSMPNGDLYIENGSGLLRFSLEKPGLALVQGVWNGDVSDYVQKELKPHEYPHLDSYDLTFYCNEDKTQFVKLSNSRKAAACTGCDYTPPYQITWHDTKSQQTKVLNLPKELFPSSVGLPKYAFCQGDVFYYEQSVRNPNKGRAVWCDAVHAYRISTGKDEIFVSSLPDHCGDTLSGPMAVPGTDYLLYQISAYAASRTYLYMKKGQK